MHRSFLPRYEQELEIAIDEIRKHGLRTGFRVAGGIINFGLHIIDYHYPLFTATLPKSPACRV